MDEKAVTLIPLGTFAAADGADPFTVTALDPATGWFIGMGHQVPDGTDLTDREIWGLTCRVENGELAVWARGTEPVGTIQRQNEFGVSGTLRGAEGRALPLAEAHPGPAVVRSAAIGDIEVQIICTKDGYIWWDGAQTAPVKGMSGAPILQDGCLVGVLHGRLGGEHHNRAGTARPIIDVCRALLPGYGEEGTP